MNQLFPFCRLVFGLVSLTTVLTGCGTRSASSEAPPAVEQALHTRFMGPLEKLVWRPTATGWEAGFEWKGIPVRSQITAAGQVIETELALEEADVPTGLRTALKQRYPQDRVQKKTLVEKGNQRFYRLELASPAGQTRTYSFQRDGQLLPPTSP